MIHLIHTNYVSGQKAFDKECDKVGAFLDKHPTSFKVALFASHIFRAATMFTMMQCLPLSPLKSVSLMLFSSVLYRSAIERFCSFRFTLPSLGGGLAIWAGRDAAISLISKKAFRSLGSFFSAGFGVASLVGYLIFICQLSHSDVENYMKRFIKKSCCH